MDYGMVNHIWFVENADMVADKLSDLVRTARKLNVGLVMTFPRTPPEHWQAIVHNSQIFDSAYISDLRSVAKTYLESWDMPNQYDRHHISILGSNALAKEIAHLAQKDGGFELAFFGPPELVDEYQVINNFVGTFAEVGNHLDKQYSRFYSYLPRPKIANRALLLPIQSRVRFPLVYSSILMVLMFCGIFFVTVLLGFEILSPRFGSNEAFWKASLLGFFLSIPITLVTAIIFDSLRRLERYAVQSKQTPEGKSET